MPRIERFFSNTKISDWTSGSFGAGAGPGAKALGGTVYTTPLYTVHYFTGSSGFAVIEGGGLEEVEVFVCGGGGSGGGAVGVPTISNNSHGGGGGGAAIPKSAVPVTEGTE